MLLKIQKLPQWWIAVFGGLLALVNLVFGIPLGMIAVAIANGLTLGPDVSHLYFLLLAGVLYLVMVTFLTWVITYKISRAQSST